MEKEIYWIDLGKVDYKEAFAIQGTLHRHRVTGVIPDILLFQENPPTITLGRDAHEENLLHSREEYRAQGFDVVAVSRGGDVSYHGPGQLVISAIVAFEDYAPGAVAFVRLLEQVAMDTLAAFGIGATRIRGLSGVWVTDPGTGELAKIGALGLEISHGICAHGMAINVAPDLAHFRAIIPCGIRDRGVISMARLGVRPTLAQVRDQYVKEFCRIFGRTARAAALEDLPVGRIQEELS
ncbi:lipoyl(octanoyl) transferase LipB [Eubacterium aggregans]|uniref:lipoyl(octanoyl) transferase LipB n=1 Tax=Eubacterium aggregans TaxID=81409 RepID=UPI0023F338C4|nr:lipoyl(octanoyl) transferase LipB [Eubacterium aggregans]MDD4692353.1 lipoyl(octanoyl) transferase LipB [Eubacterium aggregans]